MEKGENYSLRSPKYFIIQYRSKRVNLYFLMENHHHRMCMAAMAKTKGGAVVGFRFFMPMGRRLR
ncbi:MAG: hypothetical protein ACJATA_001711 [Sphingobacteriales bacterium]|jgi:hypothetical protein